MLYSWKLRVLGSWIRGSGWGRPMSSPQVPTVPASFCSVASSLEIKFHRGPTSVVVTLEGTQRRRALLELSVPA